MKTNEIIGIDVSKLLIDVCIYSKQIVEQFENICRSGQSFFIGADGGITLHVFRSDSISKIGRFLNRQESIVGSVVECSPATRAARVRFPASAFIFI